MGTKKATTMTMNPILVTLPKIMAVKKGSKVRIVPEKFENSVEAKASDSRLPPYVFEGTGEVVEIKGDYAQIQFKVPVPTVWLRVDQLEAAQ